MSRIRDSRQEMVRIPFIRQQPAVFKPLDDVIEDVIPAAKTHGDLAVGDVHEHRVFHVFAQIQIRVGVIGLRTVFLHVHDFVDAVDAFAIGWDMVANQEVAAIGTDDPIRAHQIRIGALFPDEFFIHVVLTIGKTDVRAE